MYQYNTAVFIGRFQPFHVGHKQVVQQALKLAHQLIIVVGSSNAPRTSKNPFTFEERQHMINLSLDPQDISRISIVAVEDHLYSDQRWITQIQNVVDRIANPHNAETKIAIVGYQKDESSYYLSKFPQWDYMEIDNYYENRIDATQIRELWYQYDHSVGPYLHSVLTKAVHDLLSTRPYLAIKRDLKLEHEFLVKHKAMWANSPYPVIFSTVDSVVIQSGHVLMVERKAQPGKGLWALPGGYLNINETIEDGMIRELREETRLKVPEPVLRGSIKSSKVFDAPNRSLRGRIVTNAFLIMLPNGELPKVRGSDDAAKAKWIPLSTIAKMRDQIFEDHASIIDYFTGRE